MNARTASILTTATVALLALTGCSNTTRSAEPISHGTLPASVTGSPITKPVVGVTVVHVPTTTPTTAVPTQDPPTTSPPATAPPTTAPPTTAPPTTAPPTTAPPTTAPPTTEAGPSRVFVTRGPITVRLSPSCFSAAWPITISGWVEDEFPRDPAATPVRHDFSVSLQPQQNLGVIDDHREVGGFEGDTESVMWITVSHYEDPGTVTNLLNSMSGDIYSTFPLGPVDVVSDTCFLALVWNQSVTFAR